MSEKIAVHTPTKESYDRLMKAYEKKGWNDCNKYPPAYHGRNNVEFRSMKDGFENLRGLHVLLSYGYSLISVEEALARLGQYERGEIVLVTDCENRSWTKAVYLTTINGAKYKYVTVDFGDEDKFKAGKEFTINAHRYIKPLEEPIKEMTMQEVETALGHKVKIVV